MKTEVELGEFKGHSFVMIYEIDQKGVRYPKPLLSIGKKKVLAFEKHLNEIKSLLGLNQNNQSSPFEESDIPF